MSLPTRELGRSGPAVAGARSPEQVDGWIAAASLDLGDDDVAELRDAVARTGAGHGIVDG